MFEVHFNFRIWSTFVPHLRSLYHKNGTCSIHEGLLGPTMWVWDGLCPNEPPPTKPSHELTAKAARLFWEVTPSHCCEALPNYLNMLNPMCIPTSNRLPLFLYPIPNPNIPTPPPKLFRQVHWMDMSREVLNVYSHWCLPHCPAYSIFSNPPCSPYFTFCVRSPPKILTATWHGVASVQQVMKLLQKPQRILRAWTRERHPRDQPNWLCSLGFT